MEKDDTSGVGQVKEAPPSANASMEAAVSDGTGLDRPSDVLSAALEDGSAGAASDLATAPIVDSHGV